MSTTTTHRPHFTGQRIYFGAHSRYCAREFFTRFGTIEWHVQDAENEDPETGLPAIVRQFDSREELDGFIAEQL